jgi:hypothetical protein
VVYSGTTTGHQDLGTRACSGREKGSKMGFLKRLSSLFSGSGAPSDSRFAHREYIRCSRCGEKLVARVDVRNDLTPTYDEGEGAYYVRKGVVGSGETRCYQTVEVELYFDAQRNLVSRYVTGGEFISADDFYSEEQEEQTE